MCTTVHNLDPESGATGGFCYVYIYIFTGAGTVKVTTTEKNVEARLEGTGPRLVLGQILTEQEQTRVGIHSQDREEDDREVPQVRRRAVSDQNHKQSLRKIP
jgi:hypothetical protein